MPIQIETLLAHQLQVLTVTLREHVVWQVGLPVLIDATSRHLLLDREASASPD